VVQTGVKSLGWLNSTPHELPSQSWKRMRPVVVSASKSGATWPSWMVTKMAFLQLGWFWRAANHRE
jgi:hypothetical protein